MESCGRGEGDRETNDMSSSFCSSSDLPRWWMKKEKTRAVTVNHQASEVGVSTFREVGAGSSGRSRGMAFHRAIVRSDIILVLEKNFPSTVVFR